MHSDALLSEHRVQTGQDFNEEPVIRTMPYLWNLSQVLFDFDHATLATHAYELHLNTHPPTTARDLKK